MEVLIQSFLTREPHRAIIRTICDPDLPFYPEDGGYLLDWEGGRYADDIQKVADAVAELTDAGVIKDGLGPKADFHLITETARTALAALGWMTQQSCRQGVQPGLVPPAPA